jgi:hypothetical protein
MGRPPARSAEAGPAPPSPEPGRGGPAPYPPSPGGPWAGQPRGLHFLRPGRRGAMAFFPRLPGRPGGLLAMTPCYNSKREPARPVLASAPTDPLMGAAARGPLTQWGRGGNHPPLSPRLPGRPDGLLAMTPCYNPQREPTRPVLASAPTDPLMGAEALGPLTQWGRGGNHPPLSPRLPGRPDGLLAMTPCYNSKREPTRPVLASAPTDPLMGAAARGRPCGRAGPNL